MLNAKIKKELTDLVKQECCNYLTGECLRGECDCPQLSRINIYNQLEVSDQNLLICDWFAKTVLPLNQTLLATFAQPDRLRVCTLCGKPFAAKSNRSLYCPDCSGKQQKNDKPKKKFQDSPCSTYRKTDHSAAKCKNQNKRN